MPVQGVLNRQGKSFGLMSKGRPPSVAVAGEAPGYPSFPSWELSTLLPIRRPCLGGPAGQSLGSARETAPRVKAGAKASSPMEEAES